LVSTIKVAATSFTLGALIAHPVTRGPTIGIIWNVSAWVTTMIAKPIAVGVGTAALNIAGAAAPWIAAIGLGYTTGAVTGVLIAEHFWGESGKEDAVKLYTGQVSWEDYKSTVSEGVEIAWSNIWD